MQHRRIVLAALDKGTRKLAREIYHRLGDDPRATKVLASLLKEGASRGPAGIQDILDTCRLVTNHDQEALVKLGEALEKLVA